MGVTYIQDLWLEVVGVAVMGQAWDVCVDEQKQWRWSVGLFCSGAARSGTVAALWLLPCPLPAAWPLQPRLPGLPLCSLPNAGDLWWDRHLPPPSRAVSAACLPVVTVPVSGL